MYIILETVIMKRAIEFLIQKNYFVDIQEAKEKLKEFWFDTYDRDGTNNHVLGSRYFLVVHIVFLDYDVFNLGLGVTKIVRFFRENQGGQRFDLVFC